MYTILHLDQSDFIKKMVRGILSEKGFNYIAVDSAAEMYKYIEKDDLDITLIITSLLIADATIEDFMEKINMSSVRDVPVFVVTSSEIAEDKKRVLNLGVSDYITKENLIEELLKHIQFPLKEDELMINLRGASIAVVDDSDFDLKLLSDIMEKYEIQQVDYYKSGSALFEARKKYDLYLLDMILDKEFGKNIVLDVRRKNINAAIIAVSSLTNSKTISSILNAGANDYIQKPIQEDIFIAKLKANIRTVALLKEIDKMVKQLKKEETV